MNIIFFGTSKFAKIILDRLISSPYRPILVVTAPDTPAGRKQEITPSPVKVLAMQNKVRFIQPEKLDAGAKYEIRNTKYDLAIVAAYGKILPKEILDLPKYGALNVHPSLLPKYRGPSPIQYAILNGDKETGVTIIKMDEEVDHGNIVSSIKYQVSGNETTEELNLKLAELGSKLLIETIPKYVAGKITPKEQVHENATYTRIITKEDGHVNWRKSAEEIERQIRAFTPWPGSFTFWKNKQIKIIRGYSADVGRLQKTGQTFRYEDKLAVQTGNGVFVIEELQPAGKNKTAIKNFLNGYKEIIGTTLA